MAIKSHGLTVTVGGTAIDGLLTASISGRDITYIDTTNQATATGKTFIGGLLDNGTFEMAGDFSGSSAGIAYLEGALGTVVAVVVTYSDASTHLFSVVVGPPAYDNPLDDKAGWTCSCKITGDITGTATA